MALGDAVPEWLPDLYLVSAERLGGEMRMSPEAAIASFLHALTGSCHLRVSLSHGRARLEHWLPNNKPLCYVLYMYFSAASRH